MNTGLFTLNDLIAQVKAIRPDADVKLIERAFAVADSAHKGQKRMSGEPYIQHPLNAAMILVEMHAPDPVIAAALLHDVPEDTTVTLEEIQEKFGEDIASMVNGISKVGKIKYRGVERYIENLRKMFVAMANDIRVIIIKFADRLHNLQTLDSMPQKKAYRIALESLEIYAPIAGRLGMNEIKGRLEDAAFRYVLPKEYDFTLELATKATQNKQPAIRKIIDQTKDEFYNSGILFIDIHGRYKHLYSLYRKLLKYGRDITKIYDFTAIRCILPTTADCYAALGIIHSRWTPLKGRIKDYISQPKPNGYQSLHTTVFYDHGSIVEFQLRTPEMHESAEFGIAAHWNYDEAKSKKMAAEGLKRLIDAEKEIEWINQLSVLQNTVKDKQEFLDSLEELKLDVFRDRIFVYTPKGDVIDLPEESTPIDFAYHIHTDIGNTCSAAKVNGIIHPLDQTLRSGDIVEIVTDKSRKGPNPDWLKFAKTRHAKAKIRQYARAGLANWIKGVIPAAIRKKTK
ncbi:MAG: RelA/SpoT family protein [Patescibacteria group bacterium]|nr:RelA/SpoT family protein [Patescibacteria group bacterium]